MINEDEWPTKEQAAAALKTTQRTIERHIAAGRIEARKRQRQGKPPETICNPRDIERLLPGAHVMPAKSGDALALSPKNFPAPAALDQQIELVAVWQAIAAQLTRPADPPKRWLTPAETAAYSGLSERLLKAEAKAGRIVAVKDGREWKLDRCSVDNYQPKPAEIGDET